MVTPGDISTLFGSEAQLQSLVESIRSIEASLKSISGTGDDIGKKTKGVLDDLKDVSKFIGDSDEGLVGMQELVTAIGGEWVIVAQRIKGAIDQMSKLLQMSGQFARDLQSSPEFAIFDQLNNIPMIGKWVEVVMRAQKQMDDMHAQGRRAILPFVQTGALTEDSIREQGKALGEEMLRLQREFQATPQDVQAIFKSFVDGGAQIEQVLSDSGQSVEGFGTRLYQLSLATDRAFQLATGSSAKFATQLVKDTNIALKDSVSLFKDLSTVGATTGIGMQAFVGTLMQTTGALRVQGGEVKALAQQYLAMEAAATRALGSQGLSGRDAQMRAGTLAQQAVQGLSGWLSGMSEQVAGFLGGDLGRMMTGRDMDAVTAMWEMKTGFQFAGRTPGARLEDTAQLTTQKLMAQGLQGTDLGLVLNKAFGMDPLLARFMQETGGQGFSDAQFEEQLKAYKEQTSEIQKLEPLKLGDFEKFMKQLQEIVNAVGQLIFTGVMQMGRGVLGGIEILAGVITGKTNVFQMGQQFGRLYGDIGGVLAERVSSIADLAMGAGASFGNFFGSDLGLRSTPSGFSFIPEDPNAMGSAINAAMWSAMKSASEKSLMPEGISSGFRESQPQTPEEALELINAELARNRAPKMSATEFVAHLQAQGQAYELHLRLNPEIISMDAMRSPMSPTVLPLRE